MYRFESTRTAHHSGALAAALAMALGCGAGTTADGQGPQTAGDPSGQKTAAAAADAQPTAARTAPDDPATPDLADLGKPTGLRLGKDVVPREYRAELAIDANSTEFHGAIEIDLTMARPTRALWLHADDLDLTSASLTRDGTTSPVKIIGNPGLPDPDEARKTPGRQADNADMVGFDLGRVAPAGSATLRVEYRGAIAEKTMSGIFRQRDDKQSGQKNKAKAKAEDDDPWYVYTQFQSTSARKVFPSFDEPAFKTPWQITIDAPEGQMALSNAPVEETGASPRAGFVRHRFAPTRDIPSYLVALAVGPFETVDLGTIGRNKIPARIVVPRGHTEETRYAAQATRELLVMLEEYFDIPYPYAKLDQIALPSFFGAMENPGLITYASRLLLSKPGKETMRFKRSSMVTIAHELAHQWFGNYVTLAWWDDIWLNESFATWMSYKAVQAVKPKWQTDVYRIQSSEGAIAADSLASARQMRHPVETRSDMRGLFSAISYAKGSAVLAMFERWVGEDRFRQGVRSYMKKHAFGVATGDDFLASIAKAGKPEVLPAFRSFLDQAGVPLLSMSLSCEGATPPRVRVTQERMLPAGSRGSTDQLWNVPVCLQYGHGRNKTATTCTLVDQKAQDVVLSQATTCPRWLLGNADAGGYYRVAYDRGMISTLLGKGGKEISVAERLGVAADMSALVSTGKVEIAEALTLVPGMLATRNPYITERAASIVASMDSNVVPEALMPNYRRFVRKMFSARARKLGWKNKKRDSDDTKLMRRTVVNLAVGKGQDPVLIGQAKKMARTWLKTGKGVEEDMVGRILSIAVRYGDTAMYDQIHAAMNKTEDESRRRTLVRALASTTDPALIKKNFEFFLTSDWDIRTSGPLFQIPLFRSETQAMAYQWLKANYDRVMDKMPGRFRPWVMYSASGFCDDTMRKDAEQFFGPKAESMRGGPKILEEVLERIELCIAFRAAQQPSVEKFLARY